MGTRISPIGESTALPLRRPPSSFTSGSDHLEVFDEAHSDLEDRFVAIGPIARGLVVVVFAEPDDETIRIISARWATKAEGKLYRSYMKRDR